MSALDLQKKRKGTPRPTCRGNKFALGNSGGRPRKWTDEMIAKETVALRKWIENPDNFFFTSFLAERNLHPQQVERFAAESEEFCEAYERAKLIQEERLVHMGITRTGDPGFIKFILQNKAGWGKRKDVARRAKNTLLVIMEKIAASACDPDEFSAHFWHTGWQKPAVLPVVAQCDKKDLTF